MLIAFLCTSAAHLCNDSLHVCQTACKNDQLIDENDAKFDHMKSLTRCSTIRYSLECVCHPSLRHLAKITLLQTFGKVIKADAGIVQVILRG